jgi:hypothetical protein
MNRFRRADMAAREAATVSQSKSISAISFYKRTKSAAAADTTSVDTAVAPRNGQHLPSE